MGEKGVYRKCVCLFTGRLTRVHDPLRTVSVLEPGGPGGCGMNLMVSVEETAQAAGCLYAQNAGFFHVDTRQCLGNIISNGQMVQESNGVQNAQFGIRKDGTLVFGSENSVSEPLIRPTLALTVANLASSV